MLMSTSAEGLQRQLDALLSFCEKRQLTANLAKTKEVVFETRRSTCAEFAVNGKAVDRENSYRYLGFTFHATKSMTYGAGLLVTAAKKALHAMRRCCASLYLPSYAVHAV